MQCCHDCPDDPDSGRFEPNLPDESASLYQRLVDLAEELEGDSSGDAGEERDPVGVGWERCCRHYAGQIRKLLGERANAVTSPKAVDPEHVVFELVFEYPGGWACRCWLCGHLGVGLITRQAALGELREHECDPGLTDSSPKAGEPS